MPACDPVPLAVTTFCASLYIYMPRMYIQCTQTPRAHLPAAAAAACRATARTLARACVPTLPTAQARRPSVPTSLRRCIIGLSSFNWPSQGCAPCWQPGQPIPVRHPPQQDPCTVPFSSVALCALLCLRLCGFVPLFRLARSSQPGPCDCLLAAGWSRRLPPSSPFIPLFPSFTHRFTITLCMYAL